MRGRLAPLAALVIAVLATAPLGAQEQANFSGTWKMTKQDPPPSRDWPAAGTDGNTRGGTRALEVTPVTVKITHRGNDLTFESTTGDGWVRTLQFKLDFTYTVNPLPAGDDGGEPRINGPTKTRGRWIGDKLYLHMTQGLGQRRDILTISGNVLSIRRDYETPGGSGAVNLTFNRVSS
jgi:hypothetical protein